MTTKTTPFDYFVASSEINDRGVESLDEGNTKQAILLLDMALVNMHAHQRELTVSKSRPTTGQSIEYPSSSTYCHCSICVPTTTSTIPLSSSEDDSDMTMSGVYCRGIRFKELLLQVQCNCGHCRRFNLPGNRGSVLSCITCEESMVCFSVVLFNLGLAYHIQALKETNVAQQHGNLLSAKAIYRMVCSNLATIGNIGSLELTSSSGLVRPASCLHVHSNYMIDMISLGLLNNLMHISVEFFNYEETKEAMHHLTIYAKSMLVELVDEGEEMTKTDTNEVSRKSALLLSFLRNASATLTLLKRAAPAA